MSFHSNICGQQLNFIMESLQNHTIWSMEMLDLSAKLPIGILNQRHKVFGLFDECLEFKHQSSEVGLIEGQYCAVSYESSLGSSTEVNKTHVFDWTDIGFVANEKNLKLESGVCAPASCSSKEFTTFMNSILSKADLVATQVSCSKTKHISELFTAWDLIAIPLFMILILVVVASTFCDIRQRKSEENPRKNLLTAFSLYTNTKELLRIDTSHSPTFIECLNGMRVISAYWVICSHRNSRATIWRNFFMSRPVKPDFIYDIMMRVAYAVDIFMIAGAIVMTKSCLRAYESGKFNLFKFYFNRYMRYGPSVAVVTLFMLSFIPHALVSGPVSYTLQDETDKCHQYWWNNLLMIQTYTNPTTTCLGHLWYLATDFHLYLISPIITFILWKLGFFSFWLLVPVVIGVFSYKEHMQYIMAYYTVYQQAHFRIWQWIIGALVGFMMHSVENSPEKFNILKKFRFIIWLALMAPFFYIFPNLTQSEFPLSILIGWTIFTFHHFHSGGLIRWFLSHPLWQPLAKITLSIYIVHILYITIMTANVQELAFFKTGWLLHIMAGDILICTFLGLVLYLFVEAPVANLMERLMKNDKKQVTFVESETGYAPLVNETDGIFEEVSVK